MWLRLYTYTYTYTYTSYDFQLDFRSLALARGQAYNRSSLDSLSSQPRKYTRTHTTGDNARTHVHCSNCSPNHPPTVCASAPSSMVQESVSSCQQTYTNHYTRMRLGVRAVALAIVATVMHGLRPWLLPERNEIRAVQSAPVVDHPCNHRSLYSSRVRPLGIQHKPLTER
jgi:hypothetical protein